MTGANAKEQGSIRMHGGIKLAQVAEESQRLLAAFNDLYRRIAIQECLAQDDTCTGPVIRSHSIQNSYVLDRLARNGHVYMFRRAPHGPQLELEGRNQATTFTGFCQSHDLKLFREVDFDGARHFEPWSKRQLGLLSLRALAREYWAKLNTCRIYQRLMRLTASRDLEAVRRMLNVPLLHEDAFTVAAEQCLRPILTGTRKSISRIKRLYCSLYTQIQRDRFHLTHSCVFSIDGEPTIAVASAFCPEFDLEGRRLNTLRLETDPTDVVLNIFPCGTRTHILFTFHRRHAPLLDPFFNQMKVLERHELKLTISKMVAMHCENMVLAPRFVESFSAEQLSRLTQLFNSTIFNALPYDQVDNVMLFERGVSGPNRIG